MKRRIGFASCAVVAAAGLVGGCACGAADLARASAGCSDDFDCPTSFVCSSGSCKSAASDGGTSGDSGSGAPGAGSDAGTSTPPDEREDSGFAVQPPAASPHYVFTINTETGVAAVIEAATLRINALPVGLAPRAVRAHPTEDRAVVLNQGSATLTLIDMAGGTPAVADLRLPRAFDALAISPDGVWAAAWAGGATAPASGVAVLADLQARKVYERSVGFRVTDVVFRMQAGAAVSAAFVAKSEVAFLRFAALETTPLAPRARLPASTTDVGRREVVHTPDGRLILVRAADSADLAVVDADAAEVSTVTLPGAPTDIDLSPDGMRAIAVLRERGEVALLDLPADLDDPAGIEYLSTDGFPAGQAALSPAPGPAGPFAMLFTNALPIEEVVRLDIATGALVRYPGALQKSVENVIVAPDGMTALVLHRPVANSGDPDPFEKQIDAEEGYTLLHVESGAAELRRTGTARPTRFALSPAGGFGAVSVVDRTRSRWELDVLALEALLPHTLVLASEPVFLGVLPDAPLAPLHRAFVAQQHPAGRITFVQLDTLEVRTVTGYELNAEGP